MDDHAKWRTILQESLQAALAKRDGPIEGARLQPIVRKIAESKHLTFPPESEPELRLHEFLVRFPEVARIQRRPKQDILVVPAERPELLASVPDSVFVRRDFFEAFTHINPTHKPWYNPEEDRIVWLGLDQPPAAGLIAIPPVSIEGEKAVREVFISQVPGEHRDALTDSLAQPTPLSNFSKTLRALGLNRSWHGFRTQRILESIQVWATQNKLPWKENWLVSSRRLHAFPEQKTQASLDAGLLEALSSLSKDDVARISVPLDVVAKMIRR